MFATGPLPTLQPQVAVLISYEGIVNHTTTLSIAHALAKPSSLLHVASIAK